MKITPVKDAETPKYPDKYNEEIRRIVASAKPYRWVGTPLIGALSVAVALGLSGCAPEEYAIQGISTPVPTKYEENHVLLGDIQPVYIPPLLESIFIPLFEYGEGTGGIGCVAIVAPVFLSEEEAFAILSAAFADADISLERENISLENINLPVTNIDGEKVDPRATRIGDLTPTGRLYEFNLPVTFVSTREVSNWHQEIGDGPWVSFSSFDVKGAARTLAENNPGILVFYDPIAGVINYDELWELEREDGESDEDYNARWYEKERELVQAARAESEELLRRQVEAFLQWLADGGF